MDELLNKSIVPSHDPALKVIIDDTNGNLWCIYNQPINGCIAFSRSHLARGGPLAEPTFLRIQYVGTVDALIRGETLPEHLPPLEVGRNEKRRTLSRLDNRRLTALKMLQNTQQPPTYPSPTCVSNPSMNRHAVWQCDALSTSQQQQIVDGRRGAGAFPNNFI